MPLLIQENLNNSASWALWHISEEEEALIHQLSLSTEEEHELATHKLPKRRLEWLASRLLVKQLAQKHKIPATKLVKDQWGKPLLAGTSSYISISHAYPYAAAILDEQQPVGIDIEKPRSQLLRIQHKFLNKDEQLCAEDNPRKLCVYWAAKEALYKLYGRRELIFGQQILIQPFELDLQGEIRGELVVKSTRQAYSLHYRYLGDLLICFCL